MVEKAELPLMKHSANLTYQHDELNRTTGKTLNLTPAGVNMILFTTGRGTPLGAPVPTVKLSTNSELFNKKRNWIDFDCGSILEYGSFDDTADKLLNYIISVANGEKTLNENNGFEEIAIFKDGVTL